MQLKLPLIHSFSLFTQLSTLAVMLGLSLLHRPSRFVIAGLVVAYFVFYALRFIMPLIYFAVSWIVGWGWTFFKGIAIFGFYIHFFKIGVSEIWGGLVMLATSMELFKQGLQKGREDVEREREEEERKKRYG